MKKNMRDVYIRLARNGERMPDGERMPESVLKARVRVFLYFGVFMFVGMLLDAFGELNHISHAFDDIGIAAVALIIVVYIFATRKKDAEKDLVSINNTVAILFAVAIVIQLIGLYIEFGTGDFGDEIPVLLGLIIGLANRFL